MAECGSTSDLARAWAVDMADPAPPGALVTADFQTQGRGRRGRRWQARPGESALMSIVLRPETPMAAAWHLGFVAALAVSDALVALGLRPQLKWPNDILLDGRKVAGVLVETIALPSAAWAAIVGIGVNVDQQGFDESAPFMTPPTSLRRALGGEQSVEAVIEAVSAALRQRQTLWEAQGFAPIRDIWRQRLAVGADVRRGSQTATLDALADNGSARVRLSDGTFACWTTVDGEEDANGV